MIRLRSSTVAAAVLVVGLTMVGCSSGDGGGDPGLDRIDGPAQVDPDVSIGGSSNESDG